MGFPPRKFVAVLREKDVAFLLIVSKLEGPFSKMNHRIFFKNIIKRIEFCVFLKQGFILSNLGFNGTSSFQNDVPLKKQDILRKLTFEA